MIWRLDDGRGATLAHGGAMHDSSPVSLKPGAKYKASVLLRHPDAAQLEKLKDLPLLLEMPLAKALDCPVHAEREAAAKLGAKPIDDGWLRRGGVREIYVATPNASVPSWVAPGDVLVGQLEVDSGEAAVTSLPLSYAPPPHPKKEAAAGDGDADDEEGDDADDKALNEALLKAKLERLAALSKEGASEERYTRLASPPLADHADHLPLLLELARPRAPRRAARRRRRGGVARRTGRDGGGARGRRRRRGGTRRVLWHGARRRRRRGQEGGEGGGEGHGRATERALRLALLARSAARPAPPPPPTTRRRRRSWRRRAR